MYKVITKNVAITVKKDRVYLHLQKYKPVVISAEDKFRKGVEIRICSKCKCVDSIIASENGKHYCPECSFELFDNKNHRITEKEFEEGPKRKKVKGLKKHFLEANSFVLNMNQ